MKETLIIYNLHEPNKNTDFFVKHGLQESDDVDYFFVINNLSFKLTYEFNHSRVVVIRGPSPSNRKWVYEEPFHDYEKVIEKFQNLTVINRPNVGHDFGAYSFAAFYEQNGGYLRDNYKHFIFLNSTALGPFLPVWFDHEKTHWSSLFTRLLDNRTKLVGPTINIYDWDDAHVQSYFLATDRVGLNIGVSERIFSLPIGEMNRQEVIETKEIGYSRAIKSKGYNISCLLSALKGIDYVNGPKVIPPPDSGDGFEWNFCEGSADGYLGIDIHPYEVIFMKTNKGKSVNKKVTDKLVEWHERV